MEHELPGLTITFPWPALKGTYAAARSLTALSTQSTPRVTVRTKDIHCDTPPNPWEAVIKH